MGIAGRMGRLGVLLVSATLLVASCSGGISATVPIVTKPGQVQVDQSTAERAVSLLNTYRLLGSIDPVALDTDLCKGCQLHANYLTSNSVSLGVVGLKAHTETPGTNGYTTIGAKSAQNSVIYEGVTATQAVTNWMQTLYHRLGMMDPNLKRVGFGSQGEYQVMDIGQGRLRGMLAHDSISLFPWPGMTSVPGSYVREIPHPIASDNEIGIPITVEFFGLRGVSIEQPVVHLRDLSNGRELGAYVQYPGHPFLPPWDLAQLIAIIPHNPLPGGSVIEVEVNAFVDGGPFTTQWQFTTR
jgi:hypothetical protein